MNVTKDPTETSLDRVFAGATEVRIVDGGVEGGRAVGGDVLFTAREVVEIAQLRECLRIDRIGFYCMCTGSEAIEVRGPEGVRAVLGLHHGRSIRWEPEWDSDAMLANGARLVEWLAARGVHGPLREVEAAAEGSRRTARDLELWRQAAPPCLATMGNALTALEFGAESQAAALALLRAEHRTDEGVALALLAWYGQGAGPWSGFPSYEQVAERLLLTLPTAVVLGALEAAPTEPHLNGAARLLGGWAFGKARPLDRRRVPQDLLERLREQVAKSTVADNRERFANAFRS